MKMLKFTNSNQNRIGEPVLINKDWIVSVYENHEDGGSLRTVIYGGPKCIEWFVEESLGEVLKIINESE